MSKKIRPNDPCPCMSGKKYKKCCMNKGIFIPSSTLPIKQEKPVFPELDGMPCTVPLSAIPNHVGQEELMAQKMLRNKVLYDSGKRPSEDEKKKLVDAIENIFSSYDKIQLLGALGLHFIYVTSIRCDIFTDEEIEPLLEYALSFAYASVENSTTSPTDDVIKDLYTKLLRLKQWYNDTEFFKAVDMKDPTKLLYHSAFINVRGDGYPKFVEEVYNRVAWDGK